MNKVKEFLNFVALPILSGIGLLHITVNYVHKDLGIFSLLFRATIIIFVLIMWSYGTHYLNDTKGRKNA